MPTYDYRCGACGHEAERFLPISRAPAVDACPNCGDPAFAKVIAGGVHASGGAAPGCRVSYPVKNFQVPVRKGERTAIVHSRQHLRELAAKHDMRIDQ